MADSQEVKQKVYEAAETLTGAETVGNEKVPPVKWELLAELCQNLRKKIDHYIPSGRPPDDPEEVRRILLSYGKQEFLKKFGFQWKQDLRGEDIPDYKSKMVPRVYNILFDFPGPNPGRSLVEEDVGRAAFRKDGWEFPWKPKNPRYKPIQEVLFNDLCDRVEHLSKPDGKERNKWYDLGGTVRYPPDPDIPTAFVKHLFFFFYVYGKKDEKDAKVEPVWVYYISVFCGDIA